MSDEPYGSEWDRKRKVLTLPDAPDGLIIMSVNNGPPVITRYDGDLTESDWTWLYAAWKRTEATDE